MKKSRVKKELPKPRQLIEVLWRDATSHHTWIAPEEAAEIELPLIKTAGYFVGCDEHVLKLTQGLHVDEEDPSMMGVLLIPTDWIMEIR